MVIKCEIKFDNNEHGIFLAGQMLEGKLFYSDFEFTMK